MPNDGLFDAELEKRQSFRTKPETYDARIESVARPFARILLSSPVVV